MEYNSKQAALANALRKLMIADGEFDEEDQQVFENPTPEVLDNLNTLVAALEAEGVVFP